MVLSHIYKKICNNPGSALLAVIMFAPSIPVTASEPPSLTNQGLYLGALYPGACVGYRYQNHSLEARGFTAGDDSLVGSRYRYSYLYYDRGTLYTALDGYHVDFEGTFSDGAGYMAGIVFGSEIMLNDYSSLAVDLGPYQVELEDDASGLTQKRWDFVLNLGFYFYL
jgi:hypothetical protein